MAGSRVEKNCGGGEGPISRADLERYLAAMIDEGTKAYGKLFDLDSTSSLMLDHDDLESVAKSLVAYGQGARPGPVAFVVDSELNAAEKQPGEPRPHAGPQRRLQTHMNPQRPAAFGLDDLGHAAVHGDLAC